MTDLRSQLAKRVDASLDRLIAVTQRLVAVASPNPPSDTEEIAAVAEDLLREIPGIGAVAALIIGLSVYQASFISEVYRAGIQAVPKGHREAAQVLGLTPVQSFRRIVLPQAIRMTLPPLASNFVQLIKFSSLGAVISVSEITRRGMELSATNFRPLETFTFIAVVYFFICWPLAMAIRWWERRLQSR